MNSVSPGTGANFPVFQSSLACSIRSLRENTKFQCGAAEGNPFAAIAELIKAGRIANRMRALGLDLQRDLLDLFAASAGDFLDSWFESAPIKAAFGFDSVVGKALSRRRRACRH